MKLLIAVSLTCLAAAQTPAGEIRVSVKDITGAPVEASVKATNSASGVTRHVHADATGAAALTGLTYGAYRIEVAQPGFTTQSAQLDLHDPAPVSRAFILAVGAANFHVEVVGITPLGGVELPLHQIPTPVQTLTARDLETTAATSVAALMNQRLNGVHINETQGNPMQPDVNYRGYSGSPLLGTPQGISIYMDGVRLNQPFGDVVSWDLIPRVAISEVAMIPGSNPVFGLNTLGGALSMQTKDGAAQPGTSLQISGGSFGRRAGEFEHGGSLPKGFNYYLAGNLFRDDGWRRLSPTYVRQGFAKVGWQSAKTSIHVTGIYSDNKLNGNGIQESRLLAQDYRSSYTYFDVTNNRAPALNLTARHSFGPNLTLAGNAYFRYIRADTYNADINEGSLDQSLYQPNAADIAALRAAGYTGFPLSGANAANTPFPYWRCIAQVLRNDEPGEKCNGAINRTYTRQHNYGVAGQATWLSHLSSLRSQLTTGAGYDRSNIDFQQTQQLGYINADRSITPVNAISDGVHAGNINGEPLDARVNLRGLIHTSSLFATDTLQTGRWTITLAARYNRTIVDNDDRIHPVAGSGSLTAHHVFQRINPAVGATYRVASVNLYGSYSEGSRAPTSIELGCADPTQPCKLPNSLAGDPPLKQVVAKTFEAGIRSGPETKLNWSAGWFRGQNYDDILFVSSTSTGFGYFRNFGTTRREGAEVDLRSRLGRLTAGGGYTFLNATYQTAETLNGSSNSTNTGGNIQVKPGNRIPLIPQHMLKAFADYQATTKITVDLSFHAVTTSYARGNENNLSQPDGKYYLGPGASPGYGLVDLGAHYQVSKRAQFFVQINNLLDHRYYTSAQLGATGFTATGTFLARPLPPVNGDYPITRSTFYAPGAPIGIHGGLRFTLGR